MTDGRADGRLGSATLRAFCCVPLQCLSPRRVCVCVCEGVAHVWLYIYKSTQGGQGSPRHTRLLVRDFHIYVSPTCHPGSHPGASTPALQPRDHGPPDWLPNPPKLEQEQPGRRRLNNGSAAWGRRRAGTVTSAGHKLRPVSEGLREPKLSSSRRGGCSVRSVSARLAHQRTRFPNETVSGNEKDQSQTKRLQRATLAPF